MAYEVTATKYRPQSFETLEGQEFVTAALKNSLDNKTIANAFLLSGPRGVGKTTTARILAKGLNCINGPTGSPCNICDLCISIKTGNNSDVIEIDGASNTSINDVKIIQEEIQYPPVISRYKVYIIDEVHMLSKSAFNALLKTIEEPPKNVVFIFATTEINEVPATIKSRCQQFNLKLIPIELIYKNLEKILKEKNISFEIEALKWIAAEGNGSMRDAYTLLDQIVSFSNNEITLKKLQTKLGIAGEEKIALLVEAILENNPSNIFSNIHHITESGTSPEQLMIEFIKFFRNLLLIKSDIHLKKEVSFDPIHYSENILTHFHLEDIENILELSFATYEKSRYSLDFKTEIEIFMLKISKFKDFIRPKQILRQLSSLKDAITNQKDIEIIEKKKNEIIDVSQKEKTVKISPNETDFNNKQKNTETIRNYNLTIEADKSHLLNKLKEIITEINFDLGKSLDNIVLIQESSEIITLHFTKDMPRDIVNKNIAIINNEVNKLLNKKITIQTVINIDLINKNKTVFEINKDNVLSIFNAVQIN